MRSRNDRLASAEVQDALAQLRRIYQDLAERPLERACALRIECCNFKLTGRTPHLTRAEAILSVRAFRATGRKRMPDHADGRCPFLHPETNRCLIYADRPFGCRTHFCQAAGGIWPRRDVVDLIRRIEALEVKLGGDGAKALPVAVADALAL